MGYPLCDEDLGQTFGAWGMGDGAYLVLPIFGPSGVRDGAGRVGEILLPDAQEETLEELKVKEDNREAIQWTTVGVGAVQTRASLLEVTDHIDATSLDPYVTTRSLYRQKPRGGDCRTLRRFCARFPRPPKSREKNPSGIGGLFLGVSVLESFESREWCANNKQSGKTMKHLRSFSGLVLAVALAFSLSHASLSPAVAGEKADKASTLAFISDLGNEATRLLGDTSVSQSEREKIFARLLAENFDLETISRFVLARHWRRATPEQMETFQEAFGVAMARQFAPLFARYQGPPLEARDFVADSKHAQVASASVYVPTANGEIAQTEWRIFA